jgi:hypothetical protein
MVELLRGFSRVACAAIAIVACASPAAAQYGRQERAVGEDYHVEVTGVLWSAQPGLVIASEGLGQPGTPIDLVNELDIEKKMLREMRIVLRPATKHKFRFNYTPIEYQSDAQVPREFIFNGQRYRIGVPVNTTAKLTTIRLGYEYDFFYRPKGFIGALFDLKYTDIDVTLATPVTTEFMKAPAPIPTAGVVGRGYVTSNISITGEMTFFKIPESLGRGEFGGHYVDYDFYGTANFNNHAGAQFGFRSEAVNYYTEGDTGVLDFKGFYFAGVFRF